MHTSKRNLLILISILWACTADAQDTLRIDIRQADSLFLKNNFNLIAASFNIEAQKALVIQAKAYPNPNFTADFNAYDPENNKVFHVGSTGQKVFQLEQLIMLGGKRKSEIELAKTNVKIAELEFQQLLRQLKFRLHTDLYTVGQQVFLLKKYNYQLNQLNDLLTAYETQVARGNVPLKDVVRLKGAYLRLNNDRAELLKSYFSTQTNLQTLLQTSSVIEFRFSEEDVEKYIQLKTLADIEAEALQNRPELLIMQQNKIMAQQNLQYQKNLAIPDINLVSGYDQRGGAFANQVNLGFTVPLPIWNRNQGNIKSAQFKIKEADNNLQAIQAEVKSSIQNAFALYTQTVSEYKNAKILYNEDFEIIVKGMTDNFQKRNVSILEFIDFFEAYNDVLTELTRIKTELIISAEQINLLTGKDIF
jgi:Outer membrane protein